MRVFTPPPNGEYSRSHRANGRKQSGTPAYHKRLPVPKGLPTDAPYHLFG